MKKLFAITLAAMLVMALAACNVNVNTPTLPMIGGNGIAVTPAGTTAAPTGETETLGTTEMTDPPRTETVPTTEPEATEPIPTAPTASGEGLDLGVYTGDTYTNSYLGLQFSLPEGFSFASIEDVKTANGIDPKLEGAELQAAVSKMDYGYVLRADGTDGSAFVAMIVRKGSDEDTNTLDEFLTRLGEETKDGMTAAGATNVQAENGTVNGTASGVLVSGTVGGKELYMVGFAYEVDEYIVCCQLSTFSMDSVNDILNYVVLP